MFFNVLPVIRLCVTFHNFLSWSRISYLCVILLLQAQGRMCGARDLTEVDIVYCLMVNVFVIVTVIWHDFRLTLSLFSLSPTIHKHLLILSFPFILSIHVTLILSYPSLHVLYLTFFIFPSKRWLFPWHHTGTEDRKYLLVGWRVVFLGQLEGDLSPN